MADNRLATITDGLPEPTDFVSGEREIVVNGEPLYPDIQIAQALRFANGNKSAAAKLLSANGPTPVTRTYVDRRVGKSAPLQAILEEIRAALVDEAESNLYGEVLRGNREASVFILRTLGKERGYVPKAEVEDADATKVLEALQRGKARAGPSGEASGGKDSG
jgi:hypothetical protein